MSLKYCGNNRYVLERPNVVLGTRYECFRKGVGVGRNLPRPQNPERYSPIDRERIFCGKSRRLPPNYDMIGTRGECLRKGVGVGKRL